MKNLIIAIALLICYPTSVNSQQDIEYEVVFGKKYPKVKEGQIWEYFSTDPLNNGQQMKILKVVGRHATVCVMPCETGMTYGLTTQDIQLAMELVKSPNN